MSAAGCSGGLAKVTGKVTYNGKPVTGGTLNFNPMASDKDANPGKGASGPVQQDGTYTLGTNSPGDGAVVGKHKVFYNPPPANYPPGVTPKASQPPPPTGFEGLVPKTDEVEVKSGSNTIDIELGPPTRK